MNTVQVKLKEPPKRVKPRKRSRRLVVMLLLLPILLYVGLTLYVTYRYTTSYDRSIGTKTPATYGIPYYENVSFPSAQDNLTLRGWWVPNPNGHRAIIYVHGQDQNRSGFLVMAKAFWDEGYSLLMFDLRGHGLSDGDHHTLGLYEQYDVVGAAHFVKSKGISPNSIAVLGQSLGAGTTVMAMSQTTDIKAGIIDSGFATERPLHHFEIVYPAAVLACKVLRGFDPEQIQPGESAKHLNGHIFIIHGSNDQTIPLSEAYQLKDSAGANATDFWVVQGAGHVGAYDANPTEYIKRVSDYLDQELT